MADQPSEDEDVPSDHHRNGSAAPSGLQSLGDVQGVELTVARMETRLRAFVPELVQPTVQRMTILISEVENLKNLVQLHTKNLDTLQLGQLRSQEQVQTVQAFREEMVKWDLQRRSAEAAVDERVEQMNQRMEAFRYSLEQKESALHHMNRSLERVAGEVNRLLEDQDAQRDIHDLRSDETSRKFNQLKAELEVRMAGLEQRHNALNDELWGDELGLAKMAGELKKTNASFHSIEEAVAALQEGKAEAIQLDKLRAEVAKMVHEANVSTNAMRQSVGEVVHEVRAHFTTAAHTIATQNANFVKEVREEYQAELQESARLRDEVQDFMEHTTSAVQNLEERVTEVASKASALAAEAREELEELNRRRKRDKTAADNELKALKKRLGGMFDNSDAILRGLEHLNSVLNLVLESSLVACALERQDSYDREKISLIGVKDDETTLSRSTHAEPQRPRPECRVSSAPGGPKTTGQLRGGPGHRSRSIDKPVIRVDNRCVSCSGQAPLVLAAFKMACLHYAPSPVEHAGQQHDRWELLGLRQKLLSEAQHALVQGPNSFEDPAIGASTMSKSASVADTAAGGDSSGAEDARKAKTADAFSNYAAIEARHKVKKPPASQAGYASRDADVRLPDLPTLQTPRVFSAR